ncbi:MAG: hypothetical protein LBQ51_00745, partial [Desulfovibrio sp.]|nr:hypothetical protein [Desulfovibrio sp.]
AAAARNDKQRAYAGINPMADVEAVPLRQFIPKRGRDLTLAPTLKEAAPLGLVDAAFALRNKLAALGVEWGTAHMRRLQELYPDGKVPAGDMPELPGLLLDADAAVKRAEMKLVSGGAA